jgi:hypothetical protein
VTWAVTYADLAGPECMVDVVEKLHKETNDPDRVRLVFWFY